MHLQDINNDYDTPCNYFCLTVMKLNMSDL